jgi:hypothetical protein
MGFARSVCNPVRNAGKAAANCMQSVGNVLKWAEQRDTMRAIGVSGGCFAGNFRGRGD